MTQANFGMAGLGVMGSNLALNIERNGFTVACWNRDASVMERFIAGPAQGKRFVATRTPEEFVKSLERPRRIMILVKAGPPVDSVIEQFKPFMDEGDIIIDGGNSEFQDTIRREAALKAEGFRFI